MKVEKIKKVLYKIMLIILFVLVAYVTYCSVFKIYDLKEVLNPIVIIFGIIIFISLLISIKKIINKIQEKTINKIAIVVCIVFFILLVVFGRNLIAVPGYDAADIQQQAIKMLENNGQFNDEEYFSIYTNQVPATILIYYIYKIGKILGIDNLRMLATMVNALFIAITALFTYMSVKKLKDYKLAFITLVFFVLNPIFYIYVSYYYTDTLCMPFAAVATYLFIYAMMSDNRKKTVLSLFGSGILVVLGLKIRAVLIILPVAMIIQILINNKINKKVLCDILSIVGGMVIGFIIYAIIALPFNVPNNKDTEFPTVHWIMIGLNKKTDGAWTDTEYKYTKKYETAETKKEADIKMIKKRLKQLGIKGYFNLSKVKLAQTWSNGQYHAWDHLDNVEDFNAIYEYVNGNKEKFMLYYLQICKAMILLTFTISVLKEFIKQDEEKLNSFSYISIFGAFLFYMLWEVMCRYSLTFLPWLMLTLGIGIETIENQFNRCLKIKYKNNYIITSKVEKAIAIVFIGITGLLLIGNYSKYAIEKSTYQDNVIVQNKARGLELKKISNKKIEQTFKTSKEFNIISIEFLKSNVKSKTHYKFILYDENKNIIVTKKFTSDDVKDWKSKDFKFETQYPDGEKEYSFEIISKDATDSNCIGISSYFQDNYTVYKDGKLKVNDEIKENANLRFMVKNENTRTYVSKIFYIIISSIIIIIEIFVFNINIKNKEELK